MVQKPHSLTVAAGTAGCSTCRSCGSDRLKLVLSLGRTPLANALLNENQLGEPEQAWPLDLFRCETCSLVQITETVPPEILFSDYAYFSSFSDTMVDHAKRIAERLTRDRELGKQSLVVEVASNDGYLLQWYQKSGVPVLGIEPAGNIAAAARERQIPTLNEFFGTDVADQLVADGYRADIIHANNVLAHVADLNGVVEGFRRLLKPEGRLVVECPYLKELIEKTEFDTIYHEHLCYFSLTALHALFLRHGLDIVDVEQLSIHGGSVRIFAAHTGTAAVSARVVDMLRNESGWVFDDRVHEEFAARVDQLKRQLMARLKEIKADGKRIAVYGASAKGSTLMNFFGIDRAMIDYVVDRSTVKQGRYTPGTRLRICSPEKLQEDQPDYCLLLTWNFAEEILKQQAAYRAGGGRFIIPIPDVRVA
jgi:SAM-dependent methyltransferase